ncbi:microsomal signal peptidase subunit [Heterostelium album PN500]|uniref:Signal peptidase complex subunit 2 n=1 Tax=Heterostelium pallidum (strain ATCC 26659 / Pp 5 / PN500) TaxID=670386 RepID=D3AY52_HETP5|nr:microsomal signal peptidase subunit [Heterostelium album PN500]EFA85879.1 microsomal signal peptidase subunit [Heterostelium album PN500]|eukprot:XP_020437985.1 microsomal signal peptidase subunit [Heterostelium album PN500]
MIHKRDKSNENENNNNVVDQQQQQKPTTPPVKVTLYDNMAQKQALDDSIVKYFTEELKFNQNQTVNYIKVALGLVGCILAAVSQFYPEPFPKNKPILIVCVFLYSLITLALYYIALYVQKEVILFASKDNVDLQISTNLPRFDPKYTMKIDYGKIEQTVSKPINNYFDVNGVFVESLFFKDLNKIYSTISSKKS